MIKKILTVLILALILAMPIDANKIETQVTSSDDPVMGVIFTGSFLNAKTLTGGNVFENPYMQQYLPPTGLTRAIVYLSFLGTPMVVFGNGSSPRVMVIAGVHGNELPAPIASLNLINYLKDKKINGTVIIVPFVSPRSTAQGQRFWGNINLNKVADKPGTPTYRVLEMAKILKVDILGDFHSTQPGSDPGRDSVFCSKNPTYESYNLALYISHQTKSDIIPFEACETEYKGAVEDTANLAGITAVTCEVLSPHNTTKKETIEKSFTQMIALLKYKNVIQ